MLQKQKNKLDYIDINYTDEDGISWHSKFIASADIPKVKAIRPIFFNCPIQTFEEVIKIEDRHGVFSINIKDLPKEMIMAENYICPARKTDLDSNNITVRDYLSVRKDIKKVYFIQTYASESYKLNCHTDYFDVQELSGSLSSMANLLVDKAEVIFEDNSVLRIYLPTIECEDEPKQEQYKEKERQKKQEDRSEEKSKKPMVATKKTEKRVASIIKRLLLLILVNIFVILYALTILGFINGVVNWGFLAILFAIWVYFGLG